MRQNGAMKRIAGLVGLALLMAGCASAPPELEPSSSEPAVAAPSESTSPATPTYAEWPARDEQSQSERADAEAWFLWTVRDLEANPPATATMDLADATDGQLLAAGSRICGLLDGGSTGGRVTGLFASMDLPEGVDGNAVLVVAATAASGLCPEHLDQADLMLTAD